MSGSIYLRLRVFLIAAFACLGLLSVLILIHPGHAAADSGSMFEVPYNQNYFNGTTEDCETAGAGSTTECNYLAPNGETATSASQLITDYANKLNAPSLSASELESHGLATASQISTDGLSYVQSQLHTGAAYTISTMLDPQHKLPVPGLDDLTNSSSQDFGAWETLVNDITGTDGASLHDTSCSVDWDSSNAVNFAYNQNTAYNPGSPDGNGPDVYAYSVSTSDDDYGSIVFSCTPTASGGLTLTYAIKRNCGNVVGNGDAGTGIPSWVLTGGDEVTNSGGSSIAGGSVGKSQTAYFNHEITSSASIDATSATYAWYLQGCTTATKSDCVSGNASWANGNLATGTASNCPIGNTCPDYAGGKANDNYVFPTTTAKGTWYCERIAFHDADGPNDGNIGYSPGVCVQYEPGGGPPPIPAPPTQTTSMTCTTASFNIGSSTYADPSHPNTDDSSLKYALFASTTGGPAAEWAHDGAIASNVSTSNTDFPDPSAGSLPAPDTDTTLPNGTVEAYDLTPSQLGTGNITWYLLTYNDSAVADGYNANGNQLYQDSAVIDAYTPVQANNCFQATCTITNVAGTLGGDNTEATKSFSYTMTVTNTGSNDLWDPVLGTSDGLDLYPSYYTGSSPSESDVGALTPGQTSDSITFTSTPNDDAAANVLGGTIGYQNLPNLADIGNCNNPQTVNDYEYFTLSPTAVICTDDCDEEDPTNVNYSTYVISTNPETNVPVPAPTNSSVFYVPAGSSTPSSYHVGPDDEDASFVASSNPPPTAGAGSGNYTIAPTTWTPPQPYSAGDEYCSEVDFTSYNEGYIGPGNSILDATMDNSLNPNYPTDNGDRNCFTVRNEPYVSLTGNDAIGDAAFAPYCGSSSDSSHSGIYAFSRDSSDSYTTPSATAAAGTGGSASQFGAQALSIIEGLTTASLRASPPTGPTGLTFANTTTDPGDTSGPNSDAAALGGGFGTSSCAPDYYDEDKPLSNNLTDVTSTSDIDSALRTDGPTPAASTYPGYNYYSGGDLTIGDGTPIDIGNGVKATVFVSGNVYIDSNIIYSGADGWSTIGDIPSFYIIASGNIYIAPGVTELDGVYIAQPDTTAYPTDPPGGVIDTCASSTGLYAVSDLYGDGGTLPGCDKQLVVYGAFVDDATLLDRSFSSLRYSEAGENNISPTPYPAHDCGAAGKDINTSYGAGYQASDCAAEIFDFTPEIYLSQPSFQPAAGPAEGKYNYITSLSPVL